MIGRRSLWLTWIVAVWLIVLLPGCRSEQFLIKAGHHRSVSRIRLFSGPLLQFVAIFDDSAMYETQTLENQHDINKLYGFSDCTSQHHRNSARFGWRWYNDRLEILAYTYVHGERQSRFMGTVTLNEPHAYGIALAGGEYVFTLDGTVARMPRGCDGNGGIKYMLWPYFGGDETAPHDIRILVSET